MEKLGIIETTERWKLIRELRNAINHEYEEDVERLAQFFLETLQATPELFAYFQKFWATSSRQLRLLRIGTG